MFLPRLPGLAAGHEGPSDARGCVLARMQPLHFACNRLEQVF